MSAHAHTVIAIVRASAPVALDEVVHRLAHEGIAHIELTTNTPGWHESVARLVQAGGVSVGVGTVMTREHVADAAAAGADFVVSPHTDPEIADAAAAAGLAWYPGAATPTEIVTAWRHGAEAVKVFPASSLGGPRFIADVRGPLPEIPLIPTGGVAIEHVADYLRAGARGVGIGSPLLGDALAGGSLTELGLRCRRLLRVMDDA